MRCSRGAAAAGGARLASRLRAAAGGPLTGGEPARARGARAFRRETRHPGGGKGGDGKSDTNAKSYKHTDSPLGYLGSRACL
eukprot:scaffold60056_cov68-Phaeocystis_antarctica.AAC.4